MNGMLGSCRSLGVRISVLLVGVLVLAMLSSAVTLVSAWRTRRLVQDLAVRNLASIRAAEDLENALLNQRGLVASYILDGGNRAWLEELDRRQPAFDRLLDSARGAKCRDIVERIAEVYGRYDDSRRRAVALYDRGDIGAAREVLLRDIHTLYTQLHLLCEEFIAESERHIELAIADARRHISQNTVTVGALAALTVGFSLGLLWLFSHGVVLPLRRMAEEARTFARDGRQPEGARGRLDELGTVGFYLRELMSNVSETRTNLARSQHQLMSAEKLASVGKLAASVAHEIRNPLTSIKMRLFAIRRSLGNDPIYEDDLRVVSEEVNRLERIVRNFLEFSRPPDVKLERLDVSRLIDSTLELVGHQLVEKGIHVTYDCASGLPPVMADAEQVKQVFINLLANAADALGAGGNIRICAKYEAGAGEGGMAVVRIQDTGPGIPEEIKERIFEPFFSTKDEGTGLGLSIAEQIVALHGGRMELERSSPRGSSFAVWIPAAKEEAHGQDPGC